MRIPMTQRDMGGFVIKYLLEYYVKNTIWDMQKVSETQVSSYFEALRNI